MRAGANHDEGCKSSLALAPDDLQAELQQDHGRELAANMKVAVGGREIAVVEYLINIMDIDLCVTAAKSTPVPKWISSVEETSGKSALHWACQTVGFGEDSSDRVELVAALLSASCDPNLQDKDMFGMKLGGIDIQDLSVKCGGKTPLHHLAGTLAENTKTLEAMKLLLNHGADASMKDADGNTAGILARLKGNRQSATLLGAPELSEEQAEHKRKEYKRLCLEREEQWKKQRLIDRIQNREDYLLTLWVKLQYTPKHPRLYRLADEDVFEPSFVAASEMGTREAFENMKDFEKLSEGLYKYRLFREDVCNELMEEVDHFNAFAARTGLPVTRPNSMNRYGLILNDIGFLATMDKLMRQYVQPFAAAFFGNRMGEGFEFESLHAFIVRYSVGEDLDLKTHRDDSDVTLNVCLGKEFEGSELYFHSDSGATCNCTAAEVEDEYAYPHPEDCSFCTFRYSHKPGVALMHTGNHVHGTEKLKHGERSNLILWCRKRPYKEELRRELYLHHLSNTPT